MITTIIGASMITKDCGACSCDCNSPPWHRRCLKARPAWWFQILLVAGAAARITFGNCDQTENEENRGKRCEILISAVVSIMTLTKVFIGIDKENKVLGVNVAAVAVAVVAAAAAAVVVVSTSHSFCRR